MLAAPGVQTLRSRADSVPRPVCIEKHMVALVFVLVAVPAVPLPSAGGCRGVQGSRLHIRRMGARAGAAPGSDGGDGAL